MSEDQRATAVWAMWALARVRGIVELIEVEVPRLVGDDDVLIRVQVAGLCRTDCLVAEGRLAVGVERRIFGHEIAGIVVERGSAAELELGAVVSVDPRIPCRRCRSCEAQQACERPRFLGVDVDGGFAEYLRVPAACVVEPVAGLDLRAVAYIEPIASTLAVLDTGIEPNQRGVVVGAGRITELTARVLALRGFTAVERYDPATDPAPPDSSFAFAIETRNDPATLAEIVRIVARRGRIVLKSRTVDPFVFEPLALLPKQLQLCAAYYGSFTEAAALVADPRLELESLWTHPRPLSDHAQLLEQASRGEGRKLFFRISG